MKKSIFATLCILIIILMAFCLSSCKSRTDEMVDLETYTTKQMNITKKHVIKCINEQDKEGLIQIDLRVFSKGETPEGFHGGVYKDDYAMSVHTLENATQ